MTTEEKSAMLEKKLSILQMYYAAALADTVVRYGNEGILEKVTEQKKAEQQKNGESLAARFGVTEPKHAFEKTRDTYGCANWEIKGNEDGFEAVATGCMLCAISKKMGQYSPCQIHCLSPIEAMLKGIAPNSEFIVTDTLWNSDKCRVEVVLNN